MNIEVCEVTGIPAALYGLGLSYGKTKALTYKMFEYAYTFYTSKELWNLSEEPIESPVPACDLNIVEDMINRATLNACLNRGHNKFLESIDVVMVITAPRSWWQEFDTYRIGMTKQSDSTMHTLVKDSKDILPTLICNIYTTVESGKTELTDEQSEEYRKMIGLLYDHFSKYGDICATIKSSSLPQTLKKQLMKCGLPEVFPNVRQIKVNYKTLRNIYEQRFNHELPHWHMLCDVIKTLPHSDWITSKLDGSIECK